MVKKTVGHFAVMRRLAESRGRAAEAMVAGWYRARGYEILGERLRTEAGELDLVVANAVSIAFVEVKTRARTQDAAEAVTLRQQRRLATAAAIVLARHPVWQRENTRFDVVLVIHDVIVPLWDAFRPEA